VSPYPFVVLTLSIAETPDFIIFVFAIDLFFAFFGPEIACQVPKPPNFHK